MATIGQALPQPESGWRRYDIKQDEPLLNFTGNWYWISNSSYYQGGAIANNILESSVEFYFKGTSIRLVSVISSAQSEKVEVKINDSIIENFSVNGSTLFVVLAYEKTGLENKVHKVTITNKSSDSAKKVFALDCIDLVGEIVKGRPKLTLHNPSTNKHYSLDDNTLIPLPDISDKNMILHGIEQGKEIQLGVPFDKVRFISYKEEKLEDGYKTFSTKVDSTNKYSVTKTEIKEVIK